MAAARDPGTAGKDHIMQETCTPKASAPPAASPQTPLEALEPRLLLSGSPADVISLKWCAREVQAVADEWVIGLAEPQLPLTGLQADLAGGGLFPARAELAPIGRSQFARLIAPGVAGDDLREWADARPDVLYIEPNFARRQRAGVPGVGGVLREVDELVHNPIYRKSAAGPEPDRTFGMTIP